MTSRIMSAVAAFLLLLASSAFADDAYREMRNDQGAYPTAHHHHRAVPNLPAFSDVGPCQYGTRSIAFPNRQGFRCVPIVQ